jgi:hypothetical protein
MQNGVRKTGCTADPYPLAISLGAGWPTSTSLVSAIPSKEAGMSIVHFWIEVSAAPILLTNATHQAPCVRITRQSHNHVDIG